MMYDTYAEHKERSHGNWLPHRAQQLPSGKSFLRENDKGNGASNCTKAGRTLFVAMLLLLFSLSSCASGSSPLNEDSAVESEDLKTTEVIKLIDSRFSGVQSYEASFKMWQRAENGRFTMAKGKMYYLKPDRYRFETYFGVMNLPPAVSIYTSREIISYWPLMNEVKRVDREDLLKDYGSKVGLLNIYMEAKSIRFVATRRRAEGEVVVFEGVPGVVMGIPEQKRDKCKLRLYIFKESGIPERIHFYNEHGALESVQAFENIQANISVNPNLFKDSTLPKRI